ncbi:MAG TPA: DUF3168 domain-containing protein [Pirellulales bacterium]|jgi:hypothetical protein
MSLVTDLRASAALQDAIVALCGTRIYCGARPENSPMPALVFTRFSGGRIHDIDGPLGAAAPLVQIDVWTADDYPQAEALEEAVRDWLDGFDGEAGDTLVLSAISDDERDMYEASALADEKGNQRKLLQYRVLHEESIPGS